MFAQFKRIPIRGVKLFIFGHNFVQTASITGRAVRGGPLKLPPPFPYQDKKFNYIHSFFDNTMVRMGEENAKIIVVEGPVGVGKSALAKLLAEELDMFYIPQATLDDIYILPSGFDLRVFDKEIPERVQSFDHKNFCVNPKDIRVGEFQINMLKMKFFQYIDALCHMLNTGQGVILERSYFSDFVFMNAMYDLKYISPSVKKAYLEVKKNTGTFFPHPHLVIYLDIPVPVVQERIRTRNYSYEQNSPALTNEYLAALEKSWKEKYLVEASKYSEILIYDWSNGGNVEFVVEDIEKLDFDNLRKDGKFDSWRLSRKKLYFMRTSFTNEKYSYDQYFILTPYEYPELTVHPALLDKRNEVYRKAPDAKYDIGYNPELGDSIFKMLFSNKTHRHRMSRHSLGFSYH